MRTSRSWWWLSGVVVGALGLGISYLAAGLLRVRESPAVAVAEGVIDLTPGSVARWAIETFGTRDKAVLLAGMFVILAIVFALLGRAARTRWWVTVVGYVVLAVLAGIAVVAKPGFTVVNIVPVIVGFVTWLIGLAVMAELLRRWELVEASDDAATDPTHSRRGFFVAAGAVGGVALLSAFLGKLAGNTRDQVEKDRRLLRIDEATKPVVPRGVKVDVEGVRPWQTSADDFYLIDTAILKPNIRLKDWELRIHGMVGRELVLSYDDLVARGISEDWITLNCVSNEVGGDLIGNAWWSGVRLAGILAEAVPDEAADAVLQTSEDGWTCGTPLSVMTDDRHAMLAVFMNGEPLTVEHGFPVRTIVPGLYGYVSACKWVVDMEVTTFDAIEAYWTGKGWSEQGPVKLASRIDVPDDGADVSVGTLVCAGTAWMQHTGIEGVEVSLDGGAWTAATLGRVPSEDTWVQWRAEIEVDEGDHDLRVRAIDKNGDVQTGVERDVLPDGATGWHTIDFSAS
ncbi:molybdopterin-dependent oxidoreductase [Nocardioides bizhenqiangii]|uniref:Molybdopterin-dependent oxidoreductase n=1 Tax=Nocardioides bizhenqiangii TaxID=3095076 RepID=A0ABZ0ZQ33_9ACTN|nr:MULTISPECIES: molybdopterin-dependent oxidoreductase [unclassified Nocardioides]MDZ5621281.1 molybdopterin-dependent oxidoreductase [Nocardioides sp. HM23]WQQ25876.1 molybdopterin-dependent oxidoreductase [Nocardioides sp. HM61]